jgi:hypothetical protein
MFRSTLSDTTNKIEEIFRSIITELFPANNESSTEQSLIMPTIRRFKRGVPTLHIDTNTKEVFFGSPDYTHSSNAHVLSVLMQNNKNNLDTPALRRALTISPTLHLNKTKTSVVVGTPDFDHPTNQDLDKDNVPLPETFSYFTKKGL